MTGRCGKRADAVGGAWLCAALPRLLGKALQQALRVCRIRCHLEHVLSNGGAGRAGQAVPFKPGLGCRAGRKGGENSNQGTRGEGSAQGWERQAACGLAGRETRVAQADSHAG